MAQLCILQLGLAVLVYLLCLYAEGVLQELALHDQFS